MDFIVQWICSRCLRDGLGECERVIGEAQMFLVSSSLLWKLYINYEPETGKNASEMAGKGG